MEDLSCGFVEHIFGMVILSPEILCLSETEKTYNMCVCVCVKKRTLKTKHLSEGLSLWFLDFSRSLSQSPDSPVTVTEKLMKTPSRPSRHRQARRSGAQQNFHRLLQVRPRMKFCRFCISEQSQNSLGTCSEYVQNISDVDDVNWLEPVWVDVYMLHKDRRVLDDSMWQHMTAYMLK